MSAQLAYLVEPFKLSTTGYAYGTSLRAYECIYCPSNLYRAHIKPTGRLFVFENNQLVEKKTKATLQNKYAVNYAYGEIRTLSDWHSMLFTTPELAILSKIYTMEQKSNNYRQKLDSILSKVSSFIAYVNPTVIDATSKYPEYFI